MRRIHSTGLHIILAVWVLGISASMSHAQKSGDDVVIGKYEVVHSQILNEDRTLLIHLPKGYEQTEISYPVLYLLYGNHVTTYFAEAVAILDRLGGTGRIPEMILVGIVNTDRYRDLLPQRDDGSPSGINDFLRFLEEELFPFIERNHRTKDYRIIAGPQAGANFTLYTLFEHPDFFDACIIDNPFRWRGGRDLMIQSVQSFLKENRTFNKFLFITYDDSDPLAVEGIEYIKRFSEIVETNDPKDFNLVLNFIEGNDEFLQPMGLRKGLKTLFKDYPFPENRRVEKLEDILAYYQGLSQEYGFEVDVPEHVLTIQSDNLMENGHTDEAVVILKYIIDKYPQAANPYWRLGNINIRSGHLEKARDYLQKTAELVPSDNAIIRSRLRMVEKRINESAAYQVEKTIRASGFEAGMQKFRELNSDERRTFYFEEIEFNELGYRLMETGNIDGAIEIFRLNVEMFPNSANVYDSLGETYMKKGDKVNAIKNYKRSLELNPENTNAIEMLKRLEKE